MFQMAIVCKEAASEFTTNLPDFEIISPTMENTDIFVMKTPTPLKVGIVQGKDYQIELVRNRFGEDVEIIPIIAQALPYALENNQVDAIIIDYIKAVHLDGIKEHSAINTDYSTYVLIAKKGYKETKEFKRFANSYDYALEMLESDIILMQNHFLKYTKTTLEEGGLKKWKIKLLSLTER